MRVALPSRAFCIASGDRSDGPIDASGAAGLIADLPAGERARQGLQEAIMPQKTFGSGRSRVQHLEAASNGHDGASVTVPLVCRGKFPGSARCRWAQISQFLRCRNAAEAAVRALSLKVEALRREP